MDDDMPTLASDCDFAFKREFGCAGAGAVSSHVRPAAWGLRVGSVCLGTASIAKDLAGVCGSVSCVRLRLRDVAVRQRTLADVLSRSTATVLKLRCQTACPLAPFAPEYFTYGVGVWSRLGVVAVVMLGKSGVGKSNLLRRFIQDKFSDSTAVTVGVDFSSKTVEMPGGVRVRAQIWDTGLVWSHLVLCVLSCDSSHRRRAVVVCSWTGAVPFHHCVVSALSLARLPFSLSLSLSL
jgi:hypothetical protein